MEKKNPNIKKFRTRFILKNVVLTVLFASAICISVFDGNFVKHCETEAESDYIFDLIDQGYSWEVAWDEMCEVMRGKSGGYGTGGIDGIDPYSSNKSSSSSSQTQPKHIHEWVETITKEANCKETGIMTSTCSCGETKEDVIPLGDHTYETISEVPATCKSYRTVTYTCSVCGDTYTHSFEEEGYGNHIYIPSDDSIPATCEEPGSTHYVCNVCSDDYWEEVSPLGHSFTKYTEDKPASCTENGSKSIHCDNDGCDAIKEGSETPIEALGHKENPNHEIIPASFWKDGIEKIKCINCGDTISETVIPATGGLLRFVVPGVLGVLLILVIVIISVKKKRK